MAEIEIPADLAEALRHGEATISIDPGDAGIGCLCPKCGKQMRIAETKKFFNKKRIHFWCDEDQIEQQLTLG